MEEAIPVANEAVEIEADTIEQARQLAWRTVPVPDGFGADIEVLCDGKPRPKVTKEIRVTASSEAKATYEARGKVPSGFSVVSERVLLPETRGTAVGSGPDEASAYKEARRRVPNGMFTSKREVTVLEAERNQAFSSDATDWTEAQRWVEKLQASLGAGHQVTNLRREPMVKRRFFGLLPVSAHVFVADVDKTTRVEVKLPYAAPVECVLVAGSNFFTPKARISVRFVRDEGALAQAMVRVRSHPHVVSDLARMAISDRTHDFFSERFEREDDGYGGDRDQPRVVGPVRMALRIVTFLEQAGSCGYSVESNGLLHAWFHYHAELFDELVPQSVSLLVLRLGENEYTYRMGWSEGFRK